jgi:hypothetical protein
VEGRDSGENIGGVRDGNGDMEGTGMEEEEQPRTLVLVLFFSRHTYCNRVH